MLNVERISFFDFLSVVVDDICDLSDIFFLPKNSISVVKILNHIYNVKLLKTL